MMELETNCTFSGETVTLLLSFFLTRKLLKEQTGILQSLKLKSYTENETRIPKEHLQVKARKKHFQNRTSKI